jgi:hypothetical protein
MHLARLTPLSALNSGLSATLALAHRLPLIWCISSIFNIRRRPNVRIKMMIGAGSLALALMAGCGGDTTNGNANNSNANSANANMRTSTETPGMTTEYETATTEASGVTTETRTYRNNPRIDRVVITTRDGKRTARVYSRSGVERELKADDLDTVLAKSGEEIADAAGFVADKAEDAGGKVVDVGKEAVDKGKEAGKEVADKGEDIIEGAGNRAKKVGEKTVEGAKTVGNKAVQGAKKVGGAVKDAVTP